MSPWNMMETWGVPSIHLHAQAYRYAKVLEAQGEKVVDMAFAGGLAREDHIFKALALGAPFTKLICMGRSLMIPAFLGSNIEGVLRPDNKEKVFGHWEKLPSSVTEKGTRFDSFPSVYETRLLPLRFQLPPPLASCLAGAAKTRSDNWFPIDNYRRREFCRLFFCKGSSCFWKASEYMQAAQGRQTEQKLLCPLL